MPPQAHMPLVYLCLSNTVSIYFVGFIIYSIDVLTTVEFASGYTLISWKSPWNFTVMASSFVYFWLKSSLFCYVIPHLRQLHLAHILCTTPSPLASFCGNERFSNIPPFRKCHLQICKVQKCWWHRKVQIIKPEDGGIRGIEPWVLFAEKYLSLSLSSEI